jgi:hypothetical protein
VRLDGSRRESCVWCEVLQKTVRAQGVIFYRDLDQRDQHMPLSTLISLYISQCPLPKLKYKRSIGHRRQWAQAMDPSSRMGPPLSKKWTMFSTVVTSTTEGHVIGGCGSTSTLTRLPIIIRQARSMRRQGHIAKASNGVVQWQWFHIQSRPCKPPVLRSLNQCLLIHQWPP